ncbi:CD209 antigen-like protein C isoform X5 [Sparus aurata]|uniref:CD209 antigen-like protein C isoform X5 n=1 Tax=Sparus aurata TaxID=8175 RepID=UPI0011C0F05C|nr:CD209 antigen-like protein C isoform X5 [Sparus aurata]
MSTDIYAKPDLSKKVRYTRKEEWQENEVDIYESADDIGIHHFQSHDGDISVTLEKDQLQNRYDKLSNNYTQLQETASVNNNQLKSSYETLSKNHSKLQAELQKLKDKIEGMRCPDGWTRFGCSCYFIPNEKRTWDESRADCQNKGADLVVINNKDENKFVSELNNMNGESWIGLKTEWLQGSRYEWKWVDRSPLRETFRASGLPAATQSWYTAYSNQQGQWRQSDDVHTKYYICEKRVSCIL